MRPAARTALEAAAKWLTRVDVEASDLTGLAVAYATINLAIWELARAQGEIRFELDQLASADRSGGPHSQTRIQAPESC